ncbi:MAG: PorP/SprF family type IX secretion system membrane protein [Flavobacteriales bacterium]
MKQACRILILLVCVASTQAHAQDIHFSQFYNAPFNLNPALAGQFDGAYRLVANQRTQWRSITVPYSTFGLSADARMLRLPDGVLNKRDGNNQPTGWNVGLSFFTDKAGDSRMKTNVIQLALGREIQMGLHAHFSPALMVGYTGMNIDYSQLTYDNQWNGLVFDQSLDAGENYSRNARSYLSFAVGGVYRQTALNDKAFTAGFSLFNLTNPKQSFFDQNAVRLDLRANVHAQYHFQLSNMWSAEPALLFSTQGTYRELNAGGRIYYTLKNNPWEKQKLYAGVLGRAKDAGYIIAGMQYQEWEAGISYDINTSGLKPASTGRGGFEFSLVYIIPPPPVPFPVKVCRDWI